MASQQPIQTLPYRTSCPKLLALLGEFYPAVPGLAPVDARVVRPEQIPQPYRRLLVHASDMTSTLSAFHGEDVRLRVLERRLTGEELARHIVLEGGRSRRPVEYGAIRIHLDLLEGPARSEAIRCRTPLGAILNAHGVPYESCPGAFFQVRSTELIDRVFGLDGPRWLYGRCNCLADPSGRSIAEVVEILPPEHNPQAGRR